MITNATKLLNLFLAFLIVSCGSENKNQPTAQSNESSIKINVDVDEHKELLWSDVVESIRTIKLESKDDAHLGSIKKIDHDGSLFFCQDAMSGSVYCYDTAGYFKCPIGRKGKGPGEYLAPSAFALDKEKNEVWIVDNNNKILKYDYSGQFIESIDIGTLFMYSFNIYEDKLFCYTGKSTNWKNDGTDDYWCNELTVFSIGKEPTRLFPVDKELYDLNNRITIQSSTPFSDQSNSITFYHTISNYIYSIDKTTGDVAIKYEIDFGDKSYKQDLAKMSTQKMIEYIHGHPSWAGLINNVVETDDFLHFRYSYNNTINRVIYNKNSNNCLHGKTVNDLFDIPLNIIGHRGNSLIAYVDDVSKVKLTDKSLSYISNEMQNYIRNANDHSNPIMLELKIRDNI